MLCMQNAQDNMFGKSFYYFQDCTQFNHFSFFLEGVTVVKVSYFMIEFKEEEKLV